MLFDASEIMQRLQKRLHATFADLEDVAVAKSWTLAIIRGMLDAPYPGGIEEKFLSATVDNVQTSPQCRILMNSPEHCLDVQLAPSVILVAFADESL